MCAASARPSPMTYATTEAADMIQPVTVSAVSAEPPKAIIKPDTSPTAAIQSFLLVNFLIQSIFRLILIGCYVIMGFMQGYQPVAAYSFGAKDNDRFHETVRFALKGSILLSIMVTLAYTVLSRQMIGLFNQNPAIITYGARLLGSQAVLYAAFGLCYMMTITFQTIGDSGYGLFLSTIRQGLFYVPAILLLPRLLGINGIYLSQPAADVLTILVCILSIKKMKSTASRKMEDQTGGYGAENK